MSKSVFDAHLQYQDSCGPRGDNLVLLYLLCNFSHVPSLATWHAQFLEVLHNCCHDMFVFPWFCQSALERKCEDLFEQKNIRATNLLLAPMFVHVGLVLGMISLRLGVTLQAKTGVGADTVHSKFPLDLCFSSCEPF